MNADQTTRMVDIVAVSNTFTETFQAMNNLVTFPNSKLAFSIVSKGTIVNRNIQWKTALIWWTEIASSANHLKTPSFLQF